MEKAGKRLEKRPIKMPLRNQHVEPEDLFFLFWRSPTSEKKNVRISVKISFFFLEIT